MKSTMPIKLETGEISSAQALNWFQNAELTTVPPYFLTHWKTKKNFFFFKNSLLAFEKTSRQFIISGEPAIIDKVNEVPLYVAFLNYAHKNKKKVCGFYVGNSWKNPAFLKRPLGTSFRLNLDSYDFEASKAKEVRRSLRQGVANKYKIVESHEIDFKKLKLLLNRWKTKKLPVKLKFFLSEPQKNSPTAEFEKWYVIEKESQYFAFCSTLPYKNDGRNGFYIDHLVYDPLEEKAALSFLISSLIQDLKHKGVEEINLGLNPFANVAPKNIVGGLFYSLYQMPILYRPKGLHYFKSKFAGLEEPEFFFYEKQSGPLLSLLGMTKAALKR
jgi:lysylphosphatidylglycerol synthetase-like protein (DUF2156 family)